jgi:AAA+ ATPase superfamily predicted ATPase
MLKFYNREKEIATLRKFEEISQSSAQMTMLLGRRRVGKTTLLKNAFATNTALYFFVAKKNEVLLCEEFTRETEEKLGISLGVFGNFALLFKSLMIQSQTRNFTLIVDEFQEFANVNPSVFSDIQNIWDTYKETSKINIIFCGSIYSMMKQIFENSKEPLFGRLTAKIMLKPFDIQIIKCILQDYYPQYTNEDLLAFYMVTGGIAKYIEQLVLNKAFTKNKIFDAIFSANSFFLEEGRAVLIDEFGKDYGNYFSILMLIASSKTSRSEMESIMGTTLGGYLDRLENEFGLITKVRPVLAKPASKAVKYCIKDNFLNFWFRFIFKYRGAVEMENFDYVKQIIFRDYETYSGQILERYFREKISAEENLSQIGSYWERGNLNEIDIVALNEYEKTVIIAEVKRQTKNINLEILKKKAENLTENLKGYKIEYRGLSIDNM